MKQFIRKILIGSLVFSLFIPIMNFMFWDDINSYTRLMMHEMYEYEGNIDILFLGSSHAYRSYDPKIADEILEANTFNAGSSSQGLCDSYYLLKEICGDNEVKTVYLDVFYSILQREEEDRVATYILTDYMKTDENRLRLLYEGIGLEGILDIVFKMRHQVDLNAVSIVKSKLSEDYRNYIYDETKDGYQGKGFVYSKQAVLDENSDFEPFGISDEKIVADFSMYYLEQIRLFCVENEIELVLVESPMADAMLEKEERYQDYIDYMMSYAEENSIIYLNSNLFKRQIMTMDISDFSDKDHLSGRGAERYTRLFCEMLQGMKDGKLSYENIFYDSYYEKIKENRDNTPIIKKLG